MKKLYYRVFSAGGIRMLLCGTDDALTHLRFPGTSLLPADISLPVPHGAVPGDTELIRAACAELCEYLAGKRHLFTVPVAPAGTDFQKNVWQVLASIPPGQVLTYREEAELLSRNSHPDVAVKRANAWRAVGTANSRNPLPVFIPCHRVIRSDRTIGGYTGGVHIKRHLLELEGWHVDPAGRVHQRTEAAVL